MQQKMMKYMTIFMGLLFYKVASGLCLYFIASSLWGIAERKLLPKATPPARQRAAAEPAALRRVQAARGRAMAASRARTAAPARKTRPKRKRKKSPKT